MRLSPAKFLHYAIFIASLIGIGLAVVFVLHQALSLIGIELPWWFETPSSFGIAGLLFSTFDKWLWSWRGFRKIGLIDFPDLRGRWTGELHSSFHEMKIPIAAALEIKQTATSIVVNLYTEQSQSTSIVATFKTDPDGVDGLHYIYENKPAPASQEQNMHRHDGHAHLRYFPDIRKLQGGYFTSRERRTYGSMEFRFEGKDALGRFEK